MGGVKKTWYWTRKTAPSYVNLSQPEQRNVAHVADYAVGEDFIKVTHIPPPPPKLSSTPIQPPKNITFMYIHVRRKFSNILYLGFYSFTFFSEKTFSSLNIRIFINTHHLSLWLYLWWWRVRFKSMSRDLDRTTNLNSMLQIVLCLPSLPATKKQQPINKPVILSLERYIYTHTCIHVITLLLHCTCNNVIFDTSNRTFLIAFPI